MYVGSSHPSSVTTSVRLTKSNQKSSMRINIQLKHEKGNTEAKVLIDSGAEGLLIDKQFCKKRDKTQRDKYANPHLQRGWISKRRRIHHKKGMSLNENNKRRRRLPRWTMWVTSNQPRRRRHYTGNRLATWTQPPNQLGKKLSHVLFMRHNVYHQPTKNHDNGWKINMTWT